MSVVVLGDSITRSYGVPEGQGWVELLAKRKPAIKWINAGENGNTSAEGLARFQRDVDPHLPAVVILEFGGNDPVNNPDRRVSPEEFKNYLEQMIDRIKARGGDCILAVFPALVDSLHATATDPYFISKGGLDKVIGEYRALTKGIAKKYHLRLVDFEELSRTWMRRFGQEKIISSDGIHWTPVTNRLAAREISKFLKTL